LYLDKGLLEAALIERIRDAIERGHPLGDEPFVQRIRKEQKAQPAVEPLESGISLKRSAT